MNVFDLSNCKGISISSMVPFVNPTNIFLLFGCQSISTILFCSSFMQHHGTILSKDSTKKMNISFFVEETK